MGEWGEIRHQSSIIQVVREMDLKGQAWSQALVDIISLISHVVDILSKLKIKMMPVPCPKSQPFYRAFEKHKI